MSFWIILSLVFILFFVSINIVLIIVFRDSLIRFLSRNNIVGPLHFPDRQVVLTPEPLLRTILRGASLIVPHGARAVLALPPSGNPVSYPEGEHIIHFDSLCIFVHYVDIRRRTNTFLVGEATSKDGFQVSLSVSFSWSVTDVIAVAAIKDAVIELLIAIDNAVRCITIDYDHDDLVPTPGHEPVSNTVLIESIFQSLENEPVQGIEVHSIVLDSRIGDPQRTEIARELALQEITVRLQEEKLIQRRNLGEIKNTVEYVELMNSQDRARLEKDFELEMADLIVEKQNKLRTIREQKIELDIMSKRPNIELEREKMYFKARTATIAPSLQIVTQLLAPPGANGKIDNLNVGRLSKFFESVVGNSWDNPNVLTAEYRDGPRPPQNAKEELIFQLLKVSNLKGFIGHNLLETNNGRWNLRIMVKSNKIEFWYNLSGDLPVVSEIKFTNSKDAIYQNVDPTPYTRLKLAQVIQKLLERYDPD